MPLVGVIALAIAGGIAYSIVAGRSGSGTGADDPEAALDQFLTSLEDGDLLGTAEVLNPDEARPFIRLAEESGDLPSRIGFEKLIPDDNSDVSFDLERTDVTFSVDELSDDVAKVELTSGEFTFIGKTTDAEIDIRSLLFLPVELVGEAVVDNEADFLVPIDDSDVGEPMLDIYNVDEWAESLGYDPFVMVVKRNGGWYLSPAYTIAEYLRVEDRGRRPDFEAAAEAEGAGSPEEAVETMVDELLRGDVDDAVALVDPTALGVVHAYSDSLFDNEFRDDFRMDALDTDASLTSFSATSVDIGDGLHRVVVTDTVIETDNDFGDRERFSFDGECLTWEQVGDSDQACLGDLANEATTPGELAFARIAPQEVFVIVRERDGGYFIDLLETAAQYIIEASGSVDTEVLEGFGVTEPQRLELDEVASGSFSSGSEIDRFVAETDSLPIAVRIKNTSTDNSELVINVVVDGRVETDRLQAGDQIARATLDPTALGVIEVRAQALGNNIGESLGALDGSYELSFVTVPDDAELVPDGVADGELGENEVRLLDVSLQNGDRLNLELQDASLVIYQPSRFSNTGFGDGTSFSGTGAYQVFTDGLHRVVIVGNSDAASYTLFTDGNDIDVPIDPPEPIDAPIGEALALPAEGAAATYDLMESQELTFLLPDGAVELTVIPTPGSEDLDLVLEFEPDPFDDFPGTETASIDFGFAGEPEVLRVEVDSDMQSVVRVRGFLGGGGNFEISWQFQ